MKYVANQPKPEISADEEEVTANTSAFNDAYRAIMLNPEVPTEVKSHARTMMLGAQRFNQLLLETYRAADWDRHHYYRKANGEHLEEALARRRHEKATQQRIAPDETIDFTDILRRARELGES